MLQRIIRFIFFGNYFVGLLGVALSIETSIQLQVPLNSILFYLLIFCGPVMYYTYAYTGVLQSPSSANLRSQWYRSHDRFARYSLYILFMLCVLISAFILVEHFHNILYLPLLYWIMIGLILVASVLYYGLLPRSLIRINLRNTGWLKAFVIGFVWAGCVSLVPLVMLQIEGVKETVDPVLVIGLFVKNWMFCTLNAIIFDMKDYADDSNRQLKTFVVSFGIHRTISFVLIPLALIGAFAVIAFAHYRHFGLLPILINLIPFLLLLIVSYSMHRQKSIFYYLIVIDGLVLVKALCGILAMQFIQH